MRLVEERHGRARVHADDSAGKPAHTSAHVHDPPEPIESQRINDVAVHVIEPIQHSLERCRRWTVSRERFEEALAMGRIECGFAGSYTVQQVPPRLPMKRMAAEARGRAKRVAPIGSQRVRQRRQRKSVPIHFLQNAGTRQGAEESIKRALVTVGVPRQCP